MRIYRDYEEESEQKKTLTNRKLTKELIAMSIYYTKISVIIRNWLHQINSYLEYGFILQD